MRVEIHKLFSYLLETTSSRPDAVVGFSLAASPTLGSFLADLDPSMSLDWSGQSFQGRDDLRRHILRQAGLDGSCSIDDVLVTAGAAEANFLAITQLVQPGERIVFETPGWPQAGVLAKAIGAEVALVRRREADDWALDLDELRQAVRPGTKLIFLTNPNNPTGRMTGADELAAIAEIADKAGAHLLVDEVYAGLEWQGARAPAIAGLSPRGITTGSVSKALGLQGLRLGWLICRDPAVIRDAVILRENSSEIMNVMGEAIAEVALRPERFDATIAAARGEGLANLDLLDRFIAAEPLLSWRRPQAGLIGLCRLNAAAGLDGEAFARRLLADPFRTFLIPGSAYDEPAHIRVGVGGGVAVDLPEGLRRMGELLRTLG